MNGFTVSLEYKNKKIMPHVVGDGLVQLTIHFEDGTDLHITPSRIGHGKITILGRCRKPAVTALSMTRKTGWANKVEIEARHKTKGS